jgi:hypothetical protein
MQTLFHARTVESTVIAPTNWANRSRTGRNISAVKCSLYNLNDDRIYTVQVKFGSDSALGSLFGNFFLG